MSVTCFLCMSEKREITEKHEITNLAKSPIYNWGHIRIDCNRGHRVADIVGQCQQRVFSACQARDSVSGSVGNVPVEVKMIDVNDNEPVFVGQPYHALVPLDAQRGHVVIKVSVMTRLFMLLSTLVS